MPSEMAKFNHLRFFIGAYPQISSRPSNQEQKMNFENITVPAEIEKEIKARARKTAKQCRHVLFEQEDIEQSLRLSIAKYLHRHDPGQASMRTYCSRIIESKVKNILRKRFAGKNVMLKNIDRDEGPQADSRNFPCEDDKEMQKESFEPTSSILDFFLEIDVKNMLASLPDELRSFCADIMAGCSLNQIVKKRKLSKYKLYQDYMRPLGRICREANLYEYLCRSDRF